MAAIAEEPPVETTLEPKLQALVTPEIILRLLRQQDLHQSIPLKTTQVEDADDADERRAVLVRICSGDDMENKTSGLERNAAAPNATIIEEKEHSKVGNGSTNMTFTRLGTTTDPNRQKTT